MNSANRLHVAYKATAIFSLGAFVDCRVHTENSRNALRAGPDETSCGLGAFQKIDTRERQTDPKEGFVFGTEFGFYPGSFSTIRGAERQPRGGFSQLKGDFIVYKEILTGLVPDVIAAFQLTGGMTFGEPTYAYVYRLGGADALRGYLENRFRGRRFYLQQTELRFPVYQPVSAVAFLGFGDATDLQFTNPKLAYGAGIRIGLPPDFISKIRIDIGFGRDQYGVFADFGQTF